VTAQLNARGDVAVLVPAAGAGLRLGPGGPKALRLLAGEPLLVHAIRRVAAAASVRQIVVAAPAADVAAVRSLLAPIAPVTVVAGGAERQESVAIALAQVPAEIEIVLVHDAARALTPPALIESVAAAVRAGSPAVIPALPVVDTIKEVGPAPAVDERAKLSDPGASLDPAQRWGGGGGGLPPTGEIVPGLPPTGEIVPGVPSMGEIVLGTVDRAALRSVQTPQGFRHSVLAAAHAAATDPLTDDAGLVEKAGLPVTCIPGSELALKITRPLDLVLAEALLHLAGEYPDRRGT
jgi:2-C-methyl-D-erythritol 4-phosphate cytidylyltransferase